MRIAEGGEKRAYETIDIMSEPEIVGAVRAFAVMRRSLVQRGSGEIGG